jgi:small subunit ribosomal protein S16
VAVRLRLRRIGKKKMPLYQIVAADSRSARTGKFLEIIGRYDPLQKPALIEAKEQRVMYWLKSGALPTDTVRSLFQRNGLWMKWHLTRKGVDEATIAMEVQKWEMAQPTKRERQHARRSRRAAARRQAGTTAEGQASPAPAQG